MLFVLLIALLALLPCCVRADVGVSPFSVASPMCGPEFAVVAVGEERKYTYGSTAFHPVCIVINNKYKVVFYPSVDVYTLLEVDNCTCVGILPLFAALMRCRC
jgi:hypothetical protein